MPAVQKHAGICSGRLRIVCGAILFMHVLAVCCTLCATCTTMCTSLAPVQLARRGPLSAAPIISVVGCREPTASLEKVSATVADMLSIRAERLSLCDNAQRVDERFVSRRKYSKASYVSRSRGNDSLLSSPAIFSWLTTLRGSFATGK